MVDLLPKTNTQKKPKQKVSATEPFALIIMFIVMMMGFGIWEFYKVNFPTIAATDVPNIISFQGKLTDENRVTVPDSALDMKLAIYTASSSGTCLWSAKNTDANTSTIDCPSDLPGGAISVTPKDGVFFVLLGDTTASQNALPDTIFEGSDRWLALTIGGDAEMTPRIRIASVPYAIDTDFLDGYNSSIAGGNSVVLVTESDGDLAMTAAVNVVNSTTNRTDADALLDIDSESADAADRMIEITTDAIANETAIFYVASGGLISFAGRLDSPAHGNNAGLNLPINAGAPASVTGTAEGDMVWDTAGDDLYVYDGANFIQMNGGAIGADSLDFIDFEDTLDLDAALILNQTTNTWTQNFTGTTTVGLTYNADSVTTGKGVLLSADALTTGAALEVSSDRPMSSGGDLVRLIQNPTTGGTAVYGSILDINRTTGYSSGFDSTGDLVAITNADSTGNTLMHSRLLYLDQQDTTSNTWTTPVMEIDNAGQQVSLLIDANNAAPSEAALYIEQSGASQQASAIYIDQNGTLGSGGITEALGGAIHIGNTGNNGQALTIYSNNDANQVRPLVQMIADNTLFAEDIVYLDHDGTGSALFIEADGNTGSTVGTLDGGALHINNGAENFGLALSIYSNVNASSEAPLVWFESDNTLFDQPVVQIQQDGAAAALLIDENSASGSAIDITASTTTLPVIDVDAQAVTSGSGLYIDVDQSLDNATGAAIFADYSPLAGLQEVDKLFIVRSTCTLSSCDTYNAASPPQIWTLDSGGNMMVAGGINQTLAGAYGAPSTTGSWFAQSAATFRDTSTAASGTAAAHVFNAYAQPTLRATNTNVTTTDAATVYIANAPAAGTNETITNPWALWVDAGNVRFDGSVVTTNIGSASTASLTITTDGTGDAEVELPNGSIDTNEILDATVTGDDIASSLAGAGLVWTAGSPDVLDVGAGAGIAVASNSITVDLLDATDSDGAVSSISGLEFQGTGTNELTLLQGCANGEILKWDETNDYWACAVDSTVGGVGADSLDYTEFKDALAVDADTTTDLAGNDLIFSDSVSGGLFSVTTNAAALTLTAGAASTWSTSAGNLTLQAGSGTVSLGTSTAMTANGALSISSGAATALGLDSGTTGDLNIGTSANAKTIIIGNGTGATSVSIRGGTGSMGFGNNAVAHAVVLGTTTGAASMTINAGTGAMNIGTSIAKTITIGNATGATSVVVNGGTGAMQFGANATAHTTTIGSSTTTSATVIQGGTGASSFTTTSGGSLTITGGAASTWSTTAGALTIDANAAALNLNTVNNQAVTTGSGLFTAGGNVSMNGTTVTLDADNAGVGADARIIANQGSDSDGEIRYNATTNYWELSNDGGGFAAISTVSGGASNLDQAYDAGGSGLGRTITVDAGAVTLTGSNAADYTLAVTTSANAGALSVANAGTGYGLFLDQNGNGVALSIDSEATTVDVVTIPTATATSGDIFDIQANALTSGGLINFESSADFSGNLIDIDVTGISSTGNVLDITHSGDGRVLSIVSAATDTDPSLAYIYGSNAAYYNNVLELRGASSYLNSNVLYIDQEGFSSSAMTIDALTYGDDVAVFRQNRNVTSGTNNFSDSILELAREITYTSGTSNITGPVLFVYSDLTGTPTSNTANIAKFQQIDTDATGEAVYIWNSGTGNGLFIDQNGNGVALNIDSEATTANVATLDGSALTSGHGLYIVTSNQTDDSGYALYINSGETTATADVVRIDTGVGGSPVLKIEADGDAYSDQAFTGGGADYAEYFLADDASLAPGELVVFGDLVGQVERSPQAYSNRLAGVVSTSPAFIGNNPNMMSREEAKPAGYELVSLMGQVPVKVNAENGAIAVGDPITSSSTAGVGMKSTKPGQIVGYAMEVLSSGSAQIEVLINPGWHSGTAISFDGIGMVFSETTILNSLGTATAVNPAYDSETLALRGSAWNGAAPEAVEMKFVTDVTTTTDYHLSIKNTADAEVAYVTDEGTMAVSGDMIVGGKFYPSDQGVKQTNFYIYFDSSLGPGLEYMRTNAAGWSTGSYDFAEMFPSDDSLEAGDLVVFASESEHVRRSTEAYAATIAGIVSTRPGFLAGEANPNDFPIALSGRVPTKVSLENGPIAVGDPLTTSSTPGQAMKATEPGPIVGYALEPHDGSQGDNLVIAYVNVGYFGGTTTDTLAGTQNTASQTPSIGSNLTTLDMDGDVYMHANRIVDVGELRGTGNNWFVNADGLVTTKAAYEVAIETYTGEQVVVHTKLATDHVISLSGNSKLSGGSATVSFEDVNPAFNDVTSTVAPVRVFVTLREEANGLYVSEATNDSFTVKETQNGSSDAAFDWYVEAYRKDYEPEEALVIEEPPVEEPVAEEPVIEEPPVEEPIIEEPLVEDPVVEELVPPPYEGGDEGRSTVESEEPVIEEPASEPPAEEPAADAPIADAGGTETAGA